MKKILSLALALLMMLPLAIGTSAATTIVKNNSKDVENDILSIRALIIITNANSAIINPQNKIGEENIEYINSVDCATYSATTPVTPNARVIHIYTLLINAPPSTDERDDTQ